MLNYRYEKTVIVVTRNTIVQGTRTVQQNLKEERSMKKILAATLALALAAAPVLSVPVFAEEEALDTMSTLEMLITH